MEKRFLFLGLLIFGWAMAGCAKKNDPLTIRIGSKNFAEQLILGEILAQHLERRAFPVTRQFGLGNTQLIHQALATDQIDLYVEYTGTATQAILHESATDARLDQIYREKLQCTWLVPLGFNNSYVIITPRLPGAPTENKLSTLTHTGTAGFNAEFIERPDGYRRLQEIYGLHFSHVINLDAGLIYPALARHRVDLVCGFSTDARLTTNEFTVWQDDRHALPRYDAWIVVRLSALEKFPALAAALQELHGQISAETMQQLNAAVELEKKSIPAAAHDFISRRLTP